MKRSPGQAALLRLKLARCAYESAVSAYRARHRSSTRQAHSRHLSDATVKAADAEYAAALEAMEELP